MNTPTARVHHTTTGDGATLTTRIVGADHGATATVVFAHGYCLRSSTWTRIVRTLAAQRPDIRFITFDQRGHGSSPLPAGGAPIDHLGRDLHSVIDRHACGPVILVGHSMGAMGIMSYARQFPHEVADRVGGAVLISTAPRGLAYCGLWSPYNRLPLLMARAALAISPRYANHLKDRVVRLLSPALHAAQHHMGYRDYRPADCIEAPVQTIAAFLATLTNHDQRAALPVLAQVPCAVICGDCDIATPAVHSAAMAETLGAALTLLPGVGHLAHLERPAVVASIIDNIVSTAIETVKLPAAL